MAIQTHKTPLLLLPGLLCDARLWRHQVAGLPDTVRCTVADLSQDDTLDAMADRAIEGMPDRFAVAGLSMGGYVALALMRRHTARVSRLCLMDTSARADPPDVARRRRGLMALVRKGTRFKGVTPRLLPQLLHPRSLADAGLCAEVTDMADTLGAEVYLRQQAAILARPDSRAMLAAIGVPTLAAAGDEDRLTPPDLAREIAASVRGARFRLIEGAGHLAPMEQPGEVTALLLDWLSWPGDTTQ